MIARTGEEGGRGVVLTDCTVWVGDGSLTPVEALAINGEDVVAVGASALGQPTGWPRISLHGATVLPGLIDAHVHLTTAAKKRIRLSLEWCLSAHDVLHALERWAEAHGDDAWIVGSGWDDSGWMDSAALTRRELDAIVSERPVVLIRRDRHSALVNSQALQRIPSADGASSAIAPRDDMGDLLGIVREGLLDEISEAVPPPPQERILAALTEEQHHLWSQGITGVHSVERMPGLRLLEEFRRRDSLGLRLYVSGEGRPPEEWASRRGQVPVQSMKWYADGSLGSETAWMLSSDGSVTGVPLTHGVELRAAVEAAVALGFDPQVHAIGDGAVRAVLDVYEPLVFRYPLRFFRIEHVQHIRQRDLNRVGHENLILSVQPCHLLSDETTMARLPADPDRLDYAYHSMVQNGGRLVFGTDHPIEPVDPWRNIRAALARCAPGRIPLGPEEALEWRHVLDAYTRLPARVAGWDETGQLLPGRKADLAIVRHNPASNSATEQQVEVTMRNGRVVHSTGSIQFP